MKFKRLSLKNKNNMRLIIYILLLTFLFISPVNAATYNYYFSDDAAGNPAGNDSIGDGSQGNPWKTLNKAQSAIEALMSSDIVNLYFDRGDTWTMNTSAVAKVTVYGLTVDQNDPVVHIDAYGSGNKPRFYGNVSDFSRVPSHDASNGPYKWNTIFKFLQDGCSVKNIHIDGVYGQGIILGGDTYSADYFTLANCDITNFGNTALKASSSYATRNTTITKNLIHTGQQLYLEGKYDPTAWGAGIALNPIGVAGGRIPVGNTVSYNVIYDIAGEGIHAMNTVEYNIIGDTGSIGIYAAPWHQDAADVVIRYNFVIMSDTSSSVYDNINRIAHDGIGVADEREKGTNSGATVEVYGNIVINRSKGIFFAAYRSTRPWDKVRIYNNTIIDSSNANLVIAEPAHDMVAVGKGFIYNNTSILYDRTTSTHMTDWGDPAGLSTYWTIDNNHFWTTGGSPIVDVDWDKNYVTTDPKLYGEKKGVPVDWDGQSGATYYKDITVADVTPNSGSGLINTGKTISYEDTYLSNRSDFTVLPTTVAFVTKQQSHDSKWDIGAIIFSKSEATLEAPVGLRAE